MAFDLAWFANPIFGNGDYQESMKRNVNKPGEIQRLPQFSDEEKMALKGTHTLLLEYS